MKPAMVRKSVVLPQPEAPKRATNPPLVTPSDSSCSTGVVP
jgi:hypothetical protein